MKLFGVLDSKRVMTDRRVLLLLLFGCLVLAASRFHQSFEQVTSIHSGTGLYLTHHGSQLQLRNTVPAGETAQLIHPEISPFFFLPVPINHADADLLVTLPGVGSKMADRILNHRLSEEPIRSMNDLLKIKGIGPIRAATLEKFISYQ